MRELPQKTVVVPREEVLDVYPINSTVQLTEGFLREHSGIWKANLTHLVTVRWKVLNHYYVVGSWKKDYGGMVVGVSYSDWKTLAPKMGLVNYRTYSSLDTSTWMTADEARLEFRLTNGIVNRGIAVKKLCIMVLTNWVDGRYLDVFQLDTIFDTIGDIF